MHRKTEKLLTKFTVFLTVWTLGNCSSCETPDDWLSGNTEIQVAARDRKHIVNYPVQNNRTIWPNGVVKYKFHPSLSLKDTSEVFKAFDEYHKKTCIKFEPWQEGNTDFVSIEVDEYDCGFANVCKIGGPQVAKFGKTCRNMKTMVHQLGHTLCLGHEHQRQDRNNYLGFSSCSKFPNKTESFTRPSGFYDYTSQMHSKCDSCQGGWPSIESVSFCGPDATSGLSVLDADNLNYLYNCQGCQRHRWIPAASLSSEDFGNMHSFGYETRDGNPIYTCRASQGPKIFSGMYDHSSKACRVVDDDTVFEINKELVEVFTIPGGLIGEDCSEYKLVDRRTAALDSLIRVGNTANNAMRYWTSYSAYSTFSAEGEGQENSIGKWWVLNEKVGADTANFAVDHRGRRLPEFKVLTCSLNEKCMMKKTFASRDKCSCTA